MILFGFYRFMGNDHTVLSGWRGGKVRIRFRKFRAKHDTILTNEHSSGY